MKKKKREEEAEAEEEKERRRRGEGGEKEREKEEEEEEEEGKEKGKNEEDKSDDTWKNPLSAKVVRNRFQRGSASIASGRSFFCCTDSILANNSNPTAFRGEKSSPSSMIFSFFFGKRRERRRKKNWKCHYSPVWVRVRRQIV